MGITVVNDYLIWHLSVGGTLECLMRHHYGNGSVDTTSPPFSPVGYSSLKSAATNGRAALDAAAANLAAPVAGWYAAQSDAWKDNLVTLLTAIP